VRDVDALVELFHEHGKRVTPQRRRIFAVLRACAADHSTIDSVYRIIRRSMPTVSLRTVYQVLHDLEDLGEIRLSRLGGDALRIEDPSGEHAHLHCRRCGKVRAVELDPLSIDAAPEQVCGFTIESTEVVLIGRCSLCAATESTHRPSRPGSSGVSPNPTA
jgi:Fur family transcriptional regulator, peroxide stress response regulator